MKCGDHLKNVGIVAEFDPFHNGHKFLVESARSAGAEFVTAVMSGSFMQRGECAVLGKFERARAAVLGGADLVLELPQAFACASAERFAFGAVETLKACGVVDTLCFGSECGSAQELINASEALGGLDISEFTRLGYSHARAVSAAAEKAGLSDVSRLLNAPNNTLAVEYIKAARGAFDIFTIGRTASHNSGVQGEFASASVIRKMLIGGDGAYKKYVPETTARIIEESVSAGKCPAYFDNNERGLISVLRRMTKEDIARLPDVTEGLENRLYRAIRENNDIGGIITAVKCKRYTYARICRIIACAYLGICADEAVSPKYIRVLAFNDKGAALLKTMKKTAALPIVTNARTINALPTDARRMIETDIKANDMLALCTPAIGGCGEDHYTGVLRITSGR